MNKIVRSMGLLLSKSEIGETSFKIQVVVKHMQLFFFVYRFSAESVWNDSWLGYVLQLSTYVQVAAYHQIESLLVGKQETAVSALFYLLFAIAIFYLAFILLMPSLLKLAKLSQWPHKITTIAGAFSLFYLNLLIIPTFQAIFFQFLCFANQEYYEQSLCSNQAAVARIVLGLFLLLFTIFLVWMMSNYLRFNVPFDRPYLSAPSGNNIVDDLAWPFIVTLVHASGNDIARTINIYLMAAFSLYSIGYHMFTPNTFDDRINTFCFRVRTIAGWFFFAAPFLYVT